MHNNWIKQLACGAALLAVLFIGACSPKEGAVGETQGFEQQETASAESTAESTVESMAESTADGRADEGEGGTEAVQPAKPAISGIVNPIQEVEGSSDFEPLGVSLELPDNPAWCEDASYSILDGRVAQILFYDTIAESDAIVRAADKTVEDISGVYYVFDDSKKQSWFTTTEEGERIEIMVQVTVANSDVPGALATWTCGETQYSLWEDNVRDAVEATAKLAIEIAKASAGQSEKEVQPAGQKAV